MSYSGIYIKENATIEDIQKVIDSFYTSLLGIREMEANMKIKNEEIRNEKIIKVESDSTGRHGTSGVSCSVNSKEFVSVMVSSVINLYPQYIDMWKEKFKNEPEVLTSFNKHL